MPSATASLLLSRLFNGLLQIGRSFVISKLKDYPQFRAVALAIRRSGFKVSVCWDFIVRLLSVYLCNLLKVEGD